LRDNKVKSLGGSLKDLSTQNHTFSLVNKCINVLVFNKGKWITLQGNNPTPLSLIRNFQKIQ